MKGGVWLAKSRSRSKKSGAADARKTSGRCARVVSPIGVHCVCGQCLAPVVVVARWRTIVVPLRWRSTIVVVALAVVVARGRRTIIAVIIVTRRRPTIRPTIISVVIARRWCPIVVRIATVIVTTAAAIVIATAIVIARRGRTAVVVIARRRPTVVAVVVTRRRTAVVIAVAWRRTTGRRARATGVVVGSHLDAANHVARVVRIARVLKVLEVDEGRDGVRLLGKKLDGSDGSILAEVAAHVLLNRFGWNVGDKQVARRHITRSLRAAVATASARKGAACRRGSPHRSGEGVLCRPSRPESSTVIVRPPSSFLFMLAIASCAGEARWGEAREGGKRGEWEHAK